MKKNNQNNQSTCFCNAWIVYVIWIHVHLCIFQPTILLFYRFLLCWCYTAQEGIAGQEGRGDYEKEVKEAKQLARAWVIRPDSSTEILVLRKQTIIMDKLQAALLAQNSVEWRARQLASLHRTSKREWRMVRLWKGIDAAAAQKSIGLELREGDLWKAIGQSCMTRDKINLRFRIFGRSSAIVAKLKTICEGQPYEFLGQMLTNAEGWARKFRDSKDRCN